MYGIYDCNDNLVAKYSTFKGCRIGAGKRKKELWALFDNREDKTNNTVYSIMELPENPNKS